ncbi:MAG: hypothetical protein QOE48_5811 [Mycobacterium sp.]|jgi:DNA primase|nr:hypothetical protein [Mycobacterium sp.]
MASEGSDLVFDLLDPGLGRGVQHLRRARRAHPARLDAMAQRSRPRTPGYRTHQWTVSGPFASPWQWIQECR